MENCLLAYEVKLTGRFVENGGLGDESLAKFSLESLNFFYLSLKPYMQRKVLLFYFSPSFCDGIDSVVCQDKKHNTHW